MQLKFRVFLALLISFTLAHPLNAATPTPGSSCKKVGLTATASGKKYTCVKTGSKLVWNKGVVISVTPKPVPVVEAPVLPKNLLRTDSRITANSELTKLEICKTTDKTPEYSENGIFYRNGFPRPVETFSGKSSAKILVIPLSFKDLIFKIEKEQRGPLLTSDFELLNEVIPRVEDTFKNLSRGRFTLHIEVLPETEWWKFNVNHPFVSGPQISNYSSILEFIKNEKSQFRFDEYDGYVFLSGLSISGALNGGEAVFAQKVKNSKSGYINSALMLGSFSNPSLWVHELGHALFAFEDLYLFKPSAEISNLKDSSVPARWDLMAGGSGRAMFIEWNRLLMGWLKDSEVRCITDQSQSVHYLSDFENDTDPKLLTINLADGVTLAAEARTSGAEKGLLLYTINTYTSHGEGPIISQNSLLQKGDKKSIYGWDFSVLETNAEGVLFSATKTDINKFVPPAKKPVTNSAPPPTSKIKVTSTDISPIESSKARATLKISGHQSYRIYVTAVDDFQKVYFESGFVNDSRSEITVNLTGLVCDRKLRAVIEIFTELDGKGERLAVQHSELGKISC